jgi:hypothetical protein
MWGREKMRYNDNINDGYWNQHHWNIQSVEGYGKMVEDYLKGGWDGYIISLMFNHIPGNENARIRQMTREIERTYATALNRIIRDATKPRSRGKLPVWLVWPDYPVPKHAKQSRRDVTVNDGLHMQGIALIPPVSRLRIGLDEHFAQDQQLYVRQELPLRSIHAEPITYTPAYATRYVMKQILRGRFTSDSLIVLPEDRSSKRADLPNVAAANLVDKQARQTGTCRGRRYNR